MSEPISYKLKDAAAACGQSVDTIKRAIAATDPKSFPPPLKAKRAGSPIRDGQRTNAHIVILRSELLRWLESFPDA